MYHQFDQDFKILTGSPPFPWQQALYARFLQESGDHIPQACQLPTGLGKTSVVAIWLLALAKCPDRLPRRLVYVVNRRTVVDQTTTEAKNYRQRISQTSAYPALAKLCSHPLAGPDDSPLAISTLRGQFADNREWSADPARPAIIIGTVDMIGSRLLFSGYGLGFRTRPLHAAFLGQDVLLVHDEAHLEPAFQTLIESIADEQSRCRDFARFRVMALTATPRCQGQPFGLTPEDRKNTTVQRRLQATKTLELHPVEEKSQTEALIELALQHRASGRAILVFVRSVEEVEKICSRLRDKEKLPVAQLTGTLRGLERDDLPKNSVFQRFLPQATSDDSTVYLICTSAGEVGVNLSADHLVCDLSTYDSMAQRFGRVNRFGLRDDSRIDVVHPTNFDEQKPLEVARQRTLNLLKSLHGDASPQALMDLDSAKCSAAFSPSPTILPASDILFDAWSLTTIRERLPGRPDVTPYLHGISEYEPDQTTIAWREEVQYLTEGVLTHNRQTPADVLALYPLKPHELLKVPTLGKHKAFEQLVKIAERNADKELFAWVLEPNGEVNIKTLQELAEKDRQNKPVVNLEERIVLLPPIAGGLKDGLLVGDSESADDVADRIFIDEARTQHYRMRLWEDDPRLPTAQQTLRLVQRFEIPVEQTDDVDEDTTYRSWYWFVRPQSVDVDGVRFNKSAITLLQHTADVEREARAILEKLLADQPLLRQVVEIAARCHDIGKNRQIWQRSLGSPHLDVAYAKGASHWKSRELTTYRHEFGSLLDIQNCDEFRGLTADQQDLVLHLIAAHHGYARPHFPAERAFDPERPEQEAIHTTAEIPRRFARLQRKYGRWGLAYLESLLRAADYAASANPSREESLT